jgi:hypothetical protein
MALGERQVAVQVQVRVRGRDVAERFTEGLT